MRGKRTGGQGPTRALGLALLVALLPGIVRAQAVLTSSGPKTVGDQPEPRDRPQVIRLTLDPAPEPEPPLRHSLMPEYAELKPGNSVPYYYRAILRLTGVQRDYWDPVGTNYEQWVSTPIEEFPDEEVRQYVQAFSGSIFDQLRTAAHREETDWQWRLRDLRGTDTVAFLLSEIQEARMLARLLVLKARLEISERRFGDALETLQIGYRLAHDVAEPPTVINKLVGIAIASMLSQGALLPLIGSPDAPNLYWALAALPDPLIEMRSAFEYERHMPLQIFPWLSDPETTQRSPQEWFRLLTQALVDLDDISGTARSLPREEWQRQLVTAGLVLAAYPKAKQALIESGYSREQIESMPAAQVVAVHEARAYRQESQEVLKWILLPYWQIQERFGETSRAQRSPVPRRVLPLADVLLPGARQVLFAQVRLQARFAALRAVEAIRMHAARHDGRLPESLDEITAVPVPLNPLTGEPFVYRREGEAAVLEMPAPNQPALFSWRIELRISDR